MSAVSFDKLIKPILEFGPAAIFYALAAHRLLEHINGKGELAPAIQFAFFGIIVSLTVRFVRVILEKVQDDLKDGIADWIVRQLGRGWLRIHDGFRSNYHQSLIFEYRDYLTKGLKTQGAFTFALSDIFVPLKVSSKTAHHISQALIQAHPDNPNSKWDIWTLFEKTKQRQRNPKKPKFAIIGPPGSGKTTLLEHIVLTYAEQKQRQYNRHALNLLPILFRLREVQEDICTENPKTLVALFNQQAEKLELKPPSNWIEKHLKDGHCLVMLDGLDEVASNERRQTVTKWIETQIKIYGGNAYLLTSRPYGYKSAPISGIDTLEVKPYSLSQMQQFIHNWYLQTEIRRRKNQKEDKGVRKKAKTMANELIQRIQESPPIAAMALNPLLLTMITTVHLNRGALPGRRVELYSEICDVLLGRRRAAKGIDEQLTSEQKQAVLQVLALDLMKLKTRTFNLNLGSDIISQKLRAISEYNISPEDFLEYIEKLCGLLVEKEKGRLPA